MSDEGWTRPESINFGATTMFAFRLCQALVAKGTLTQAEAAGVLTATANDVRSGTEDGVGEQLGEANARVFEQLAAWVLGQPGDS